MARKDDLGRLMDNLRIRLPGALDATLQLELFNVLDEFFQASNAWTETIDFTVAPGTTTFTVAPTMGTINRLLWVTNADGAGQSASMATPGEIVLPAEPAATESWKACVALTVTDPVSSKDGAPVFPEWFLSKYGNHLLDGVLSRMMSQVAKPYSNPQMAVYHGREFRSAISCAKVEAQHANVYRGQAWRFPAFTGRRGRH